jgi:hypothetical protein
MEKVMQWQPIHTFDKSQIGKSFLVWNEEMGCNLICEMEADEKWYLDFGDVFELTQEAITHWMDLPEPPK